MSGFICARYTIAHLTSKTRIIHYNQETTTHKLSQIRIETNKNREKESQINGFLLSSTRKENDISWRWSNGIGLDAVKNKDSICAIVFLTIQI